MIRVLDNSVSISAESILACVGPLLTKRRRKRKGIRQYAKRCESERISGNSINLSVVASALRWCIHLSSIY